MTNEQWISVKDRLPEAGKIVIVEGGCGFHLSGLWYSIVDSGKDNPKPIQWTVTHWQHVPTIEFCECITETGFPETDGICRRCRKIKRFTPSEKSEATESQAELLLEEFTNLIFTEDKEE